MAKPPPHIPPGKPGILFMGTPDFAVPCLEALAGGEHRVVAVVTQPDRARGRGRKVDRPPVKQAARLLGLSVLQPEKAADPAFLEEVRALSPDLIVVVAFGQILKSSLLALPPWGVLNIHASLLPRYRGAAPIQWAIFRDEAETGLTAMRMDAGMDTGPILHVWRTPVHPGETAGELHDRLAAASGPFLLETLALWSAGSLKETPQDDSLATYAPKIERAMTRIDWERPAGEVAAFIRALDPWPGASTRLDGREVKLFSALVWPGAPAAGTPGTVVDSRPNTLVVRAGDGAVEIRALQLPGKRRLVAEEFLRGFPIAPRTKLGEKMRR